jgi:hypothetical protein
MTRFRRLLTFSAVVLGLSQRLMYTIVRIWKDKARFWTFAAVKLRATYNWEVVPHHWVTVR